MTIEERLEKPQSTEEWADRFRKDANAIEDGCAPGMEELHPKIRKALIDSYRSEAEVLEDQLMAASEDPFLQPIS